MERVTDSNVLYKLENGYQLTKISGENCTLLLRDNKAQVVAFIESCNGKMTQVAPYRNRCLTDYEKHMLLRFIRNNHYAINTEVAAALDISIFREGDGPEEYLSERQLQKRLKNRLKDVHLFVGKLKTGTLRIPSFSKGGVYNLTRAEIKKLVIEKNCDLLIDMRDNLSIEALRVQESFTGSINMSRNTVESIIIGNNCRCDLAVYDSLRCFNLIIADLYCGSLYIKLSCFHAVNIGFYCYAVIKLASNWGRRDITVGDSFRGSLTVDNVDVSKINIGNDCKGKVTLSGKALRCGRQELKIAEDFAGSLDAGDSCSLQQIAVGRHARGRISLLGCPAVKVVKFDKYFSGYADFSESTVEYVHAKYGCSGEMVFLGCENLALLKLPRDRSSEITIEKEPLEVLNDNNSLYYRYTPEPLSPAYYTPLYRRVFNGVKSFLTGEPA